MVRNREIFTAVLVQLFPQIREMDFWRRATHIVSIDPEIGRVIVKIVDIVVSTEASGVGTFKRKECNKFTGLVITSSKFLKPRPALGIGGYSSKVIRRRYEIEQRDIPCIMIAPFGVKASPCRAVGVSGVNVQVAPEKSVGRVP
jgi:hypothetical protein